MGINQNICHHKRVSLVDGYCSDCHQYVIESQSDLSKELHETQEARIKRDKSIEERVNIEWKEKLQAIFINFPNMAKSWLQNYLDLKETIKELIKWT